MRWSGYGDGMSVAKTRISFFCGGRSYTLLRWPKLLPKKAVCGWKMPVGVHIF